MCGSELIIRTRRQTNVCELLPKHALNGDFSHAFVEDYAHWLDMNTGLVEWRPLTDAWTISADNWDMASDLDGNLFLSRGTQRLIDVCSPNAMAISFWKPGRAEGVARARWRMAWTQGCVGMVMVMG